MLIDLYKMKSYNFPLLNLIDSCRDFSKLHEYQQYLSDWKNVFSHFSKLINKEKESFIIRSRKYNHEVFKQYEFYQFNQNFCNLNSNYLYHFDICTIINKLNLKSCFEIPIKRFELDIKYEKLSIDKFNLNTKKPVILVPFILPDYNYIVIDGNKRLNFYYKENFNMVNSIIFNPVDTYDFLLSIDWAVYWFTNEINYLFSELNHDFINKIKNSIIYQKSNLFSDLKVKYISS